MAKHNLRLAAMGFLVLVLAACEGSSNTVPGDQQKQAQADEIALRMFSPSINESGVELVTATLSAASVTDVTLLWEVTSNKGRLDADSGALIIPAGQLSGSYFIHLPEDSVYQGGQLLSMRVSDQAGHYKAGEIPVTLNDNDSMPFVSIADVEGGRGSRLDLIVSLSSVSGVDTSIQWKTADATAHAGVDYTAESGIAIIPAGARTATLSVTTLPLASDSSFVVQLTGAQEARIADGSATATIRSGATLDTLVSFALANATVKEDAGTVAVDFTLSRASANPVTVDFNVSGTALASEDFRDVVHQITIPAGQLSARLNLEILDDAVFEKQENVVFDMTGAVNAGFGGIIRSEIKIDDNDSTPNLSIQDVQVTEGQPLTFAVTLDKASGADTWFSYKTVTGTASEADFTAVSGTIVIPKGSTVANITVPSTSDSLFEEREVFSVVITQAGGALLLKGSANGTLIDNDPMPTVGFSLASQTVPLVQNTVEIDVALSAVSGANVTVPFMVSGSSIPGVHHNLAPSLVTIPAGQTHATIVFNIFAHGPPERSVIVDLTSPSNASLGTGITHSVLF